MTRRTTLGPKFLSLSLPVFFVVFCLGASGAVAGDECTTPGNYVQVRVSTLDPPIVAPGDDDQPTIGSRKRGRQVDFGTSPENPPPVEKAATRPSRTGVGWFQSIREFVGHLGVLLLRMPS